MWCLCFDAYARLVLPGLRKSLPRNLAYTGALVAHIGVLVIIFGFLGNYRGLQADIGLKAGETKQVFGYDVRLADVIQVQKQDNVDLYMAPIEISRQGQLIAKMQPARSKYPTSTDLLHEIAVDSRLWRDIYIVLRDFDRSDGKQVSLQINYNPTVRFVWIATIIMVLGGLIALADPYRGDRTRDALATRWGDT
jgi:cytochrome c-type biogenesis protein CcmF